MQRSWSGSLYSSLLLAVVRLSLCRDGQYTSTSCRRDRGAAALPCNDPPGPAFRSGPDPGGPMTRYPRPERWLLLLMLLVALAGCSVSLIQPYDDVIEKTASDFYEDFLRFTISVGRTRGTYADNRAFYDKWQPKLTTLTARAVAANPSGRCPSAETYGGLMPQ